MNKLLKRSLLSAVLLVVVLVLIAGWMLRGVSLTSSSVLLNAITGRGIETPKQNELQRRLQLPEGFHLQVYASQLPMVRMLLVTPAGDVLASRPRAGEVVLLRDRNGDGVADERATLLRDLNRPHGLALWKGWLYVAETDGVSRIRFDANSGQVQGDFERIIPALPGGGNHWSRSIAFGPDDKLYVTVGSSCNVCEEPDNRRAAMLRYEPDGSAGTVFASGLRNTVGFDFAPWNNNLYGTDNGRDLLTDDFPPCELNQIREGGFYGWPYINGFGVPDPDLGQWGGERATHAIPPVHGFTAHSAPLGIRFLKAIDWPGYERSALVALHGSWNRTEPSGYKVVSLHWENDGTIQERDFITGFERDGEIIGRPVDIALGQRGGIYLSDDYAGAIYRISQRPLTAASTEAPNVQPPQAAMPEQFAALAPLERAELIRQGREQFQHWNCLTCHRQPGGKPLKQLGQRYDIQSLSEFLQTPNPPMPAFPMSDGQRRALAVYLLARHGGQ